MRTSLISSRSSVPNLPRCVTLRSVSLVSSRLLSGDSCPLAVRHPRMVRLQGVGPLASPLRPKRVATFESPMLPWVSLCPVSFASSRSPGGSMASRPGSPFGLRSLSRSWRARSTWETHEALSSENRLSTPWSATPKRVRVPVSRASTALGGVRCDRGDGGRSPGLSLPRGGV